MITFLTGNLFLVFHFFEISQMVFLFFIIDLILTEVT